MRTEKLKLKNEKTEEKIEIKLKKLTKSETEKTKFQWPIISATDGTMLATPPNDFKYLFNGASQC